MRPAEGDRRVDLRPAVGHRLWQKLAQRAARGSTPAEGLRGQGEIAGSGASPRSPSFATHLGYPVGERDRHDLALPAAPTDLPLPPRLST